jgi:hypothetical protein
MSKLPPSRYTLVLTFGKRVVLYKNVNRLSDLDAKLDKYISEYGSPTKIDIILDDVPSKSIIKVTNG